MAYKPEEILTELKSNKYAPFYFLQGDEPYYIDEITKWIEENALPSQDKGFNQVVVFGKDVNIGNILSHARRFPMMAERQVVIVKEAQEIQDFGNEEAQELLAKYAEKPLPSTILVLAHKNKSLDSRKKLAKALDKFAKLVDCKKVRDYELDRWLENYCKANGLKMNPNARQMLIENIGADLQRMSNEINKVLIRIDKNQEITPEIIENNIGISKEFNVFEWQKAIGTRNYAKAFQIAEYFASNPQQNPAVMLIASLFNYFTKLLLIHQSQDKSERNLASVMGINPYIVREYVAASKNYNLYHVLNAIHQLRIADNRVKGIGGTFDARAIYYELLAKIFIT